MAIVVVNKNIYKVDSLYQWDKNQVLEIQGLSLSTIPEIHFTNDAMDRAIVRQATMDDKGIITVEIPNSLLQKPYKITVYVCIYEDETFKSLYKLEIPVKARKKPGDYTLENDEEVYSFNALENLINNTLTVLTEKCDDTIERADEYYNKTIADTINVKDEAIEEITEVKNTGVLALTQIKENAVSEMNIIKDNTINEATEIKNEAIEECERIKEELLNNSSDSLLEDIEELRDDLDNHITEMTPISQIVEGSTKPITSGAIHSLKTELNDSLENLSIQDWTLLLNNANTTGNKTVSKNMDTFKEFLCISKYTNGCVLASFTLPKEVFAVSQSGNDSTAMLSAFLSNGTTFTAVAFKYVSGTTINVQLVKECSLSIYAR